jgi:ABC-2 type transport system permease protein
MKGKKAPFPFDLLRFWACRALVAWFFIALVIFLFQLNICAMVNDDEKIKAILQLMDRLPSFIKSSLGGEILRVGNTSALLAIGYQHPLVLLLYMLFAVGVPTTLLAGELQKGTMELILSRSVTKTHVYVCAAVVTITGMLGLILAMFMGTVVGTSIYDFGPDLVLYPFFKASVVGGLLASSASGITLLAAASFQRNFAIWVTVGYLVANYFIAVFAEWWAKMAWLSPATIFHYVDGPRIFRESGWPTDDMSVLAGMLIVSTVLGGVIWSRRDLRL